MLVNVEAKENLYKVYQQITRSPTFLFKIEKTSDLSAITFHTHQFAVFRLFFMEPKPA